MSVSRVICAQLHIPGCPGGPGGPQCPSPLLPLNPLGPMSPMGMIGLWLKTTSGVCVRLSCRNKEAMVPGKLGFILSLFSMQVITS